MVFCYVGEGNKCPCIPQTFVIPSMEDVLSKSWLSQWVREGAYVLSLLSTWNLFRVVCLSCSTSHPSFSQLPAAWLLPMISYWMSFLIWNWRALSLLEISLPMATLLPSCFSVSGWVSHLFSWSQAHTDPPCISLLLMALTMTSEVMTPACQSPIVQILALWLYLIGCERQACRVKNGPIMFLPRCHDVSEHFRVPLPQGKWF